VTEAERWYLGGGGMEKGKRVAAYPVRSWFWRRDVEATNTNPPEVMKLYGRILTTPRTLVRKKRKIPKLPYRALCGKWKR